MLSILAAITTLALSAAPAPAPGTSEIRRAMAEISANDSIQRDLPGQATPTGAQVAHVRDRATVPPEVGPLAQGIGQVLLVALLVGVVIALIAWLAGRARPRRDPLSQQRDAAPTRAPPEGEPEVLDPDHLARERRFREAIRALLSRALAAAWPRGDTPAALTSREVLANLRLAAPAHGALAELVRAAEVCDFAPGVVTADDYHRISDLYDAFASAREGSA